CAAPRRDEIPADLDHQAGYARADGRQMTKQRLGEGAVAAGAVERDIVGLRREGDEKARRIADPRQAFRARGNGSVFQRIGSARVQKDQMDALALLRLEHLVETHAMSV